MSARIDYALALAAKSACRDEWLNAKHCATDAYNAGLAVGYQKRVDEECRVAWPLAQYVTGNKSKTGLSDRVLHDMFTGRVA